MSDVSLVNGHIDNGMSDEDIIKALDCCDNSFCDKCPYKPKLLICREELCHDTLDLINRQKAEIERLTTKCEDCAGCNQWKCDCFNERAEAIKEFAERLKKGMCYDGDYNDMITTEGYIKKVIKEMTESRE